MLTAEGPFLQVGKSASMYSRNLFVLDFARRFLSVVPQFLRRTLIKFGCDWQKIDRKGKCMKDSESTSSIKGRKAGIGELSWLFSRGV